MGKIVEFLYCYLNDSLAHGDRVYNYTRGADINFINKNIDYWNPHFDLNKFDLNGSVVSSEQDELNYDIVGYAYFYNKQEYCHVFVASKNRNNLKKVANFRGTREANHGLILEDLDVYAIDAIKASILTQNIDIQMNEQGDQEAIGADVMTDDDRFDVIEENYFDRFLNFQFDQLYFNKNKEMIKNIFAALVNAKMQGERVVINCNKHSKEDALKLLEHALKLFPKYVANKFSFAIDMANDDSNIFDITLLTTSDSEIIEYYKKNIYYFYINKETLDTDARKNNEVNPIVDLLFEHDFPWINKNVLQNELIKSESSFDNYLDKLNAIALSSKYFEYSSSESLDLIIEKLNQYLKKISYIYPLIDEYKINVDCNALEFISLINTNSMLKQDSLKETCELALNLNNKFGFELLFEAILNQKCNYSTLCNFLSNYSFNDEKVKNFYKYVVNNKWDEFNDLIVKACKTQDSKSAFIDLYYALFKAFNENALESNEDIYIDVASFIIGKENDGFLEISKILLENSNFSREERLMTIIGCIESLPDENFKNKCKNEFVSLLVSDKSSADNLNALIRIKLDNDHTLSNNYSYAFALELLSIKDIQNVQDYKNVIITYNNYLESGKLSDKSKDELRSALLDNILPQFKVDVISAANIRQFINPQGELFLNILISLVKENRNLTELTKVANERFKELQTFRKNEIYEESIKEFRNEAIIRALLRLPDKEIIQILNSLNNGTNAGEVYVDSVFITNNAKKTSDDPNFAKAVSIIVKDYLMSKKVNRDEKIDFVKKINDRVKKHQEKDNVAQIFDVSRNVGDMVLFVLTFAVLSFTLSYLLYSRLFNNSFFLYFCVLTGFATIAPLFFYIYNMDEKIRKRRILKTLLEGFAILLVLFVIPLLIGLIK